MFTKKRGLADYFVSWLNKIEAELASNADVDATRMAHMLGQRQALMNIYKYIQGVSSDELVVEDMILFLDKNFKTVRDLAFDENLGQNYPYDKKLALGKILVYNTARHELSEIKKEQEKAISD